MYFKSIEFNRLNDFYNKNGLIWFNKKGIITNFYYSSGSNDILEKLKHGINHGP